MDRYRVEPYVLAADIYNSAQHRGRGGWTWYTGSASWLWRFGIEGLLGLRRAGDELIFDPCIPGEWPGFTAQINTGKGPVEVEVRNPQQCCRGVRALETGKLTIDSNRIALSAAAGQKVIVHMGEQ